MMLGMGIGCFSYRIVRKDFSDTLNRELKMSRRRTHQAKKERAKAPRWQ